MDSVGKIYEPNLRNTTPKQGWDKYFNGRWLRLFDDLKETNGKVSHKLMDYWLNCNFVYNADWEMPDADLSFNDFFQSNETLGPCWIVTLKDEEWSMTPYCDVGELDDEYKLYEKEKEKYSELLKFEDTKSLCEHFENTNDGKSIVDTMLFAHIQSLWEDYEFKCGN